MKSTPELDHALGKPKPASGLPSSTISPEDSEIRALKDKAKRVRARTARFSDREIQDALARVLDG